MSTDQFMDDCEKSSINLATLDMVSVIEKKTLFDDIVQQFPLTLGKAVSKKEREELDLNSSTLVYGEITFETLGMIFEKIKKVYGKPDKGFSGYSSEFGFLQERGGIFYDLGSGTGKGVIGAAVLHNFDACYGIEILEGLYAVSLDAVNCYNTKGKPKLSGRSTETRKKRSSFLYPCSFLIIFSIFFKHLDCQMIHGDFLKLRFKDWRDADIVFANSTCYDEDIMIKMAKLSS
jgi:hypothetical protein